MAENLDVKQASIRVWDLPVRLFHWCQAGLFVAMWATAEFGEMDWHLWLAYCLITLWTSRIVWGFIGSDTARFSQFLRSPIAAWGYLRGSPHTQLGHNPAGGWMVMLLLLLMGLQFGSGLFTSDDIFTEGPLYSLVSDDVASFMGWWHEVNFNLLLAAVALHLLAVIVYEVKGHRLISAMFSGVRLRNGEPEVTFRASWLWWLVLLIGGGVLYYWWQPSIPW
ncbi:cytochrome b/b6 domain-containing protein [Corallincola spongiicola]|uniref:Cytochrome B n=1 Tax=Corallincola spongiicola TaxID=2520508 RepID=A0ABY1WRW1_9GAMM|nr:cytochrome b/b6 domain-containing protein [Corallincola spongiicola]TAA47482.1 cytochrome B [Corallincola spongiicola]